MIAVEHTGPATHPQTCDACHDTVRPGEPVATVRHPDHHDPMFAHARCVRAMEEASWPTSN